MLKRSSVQVGLVAMASLLTPAAASAADRLPDLGMAQVKDIRIDKTFDGRRVLRYSTLIVSLGSGPFEVRASRTSATELQIPAAQRIYDDGGGHRDADPSTVLVYGGDGHNHWHVRDLERSDLLRLDNGVKVGAGAKHGFCFWDNTAYRLGLLGAPPSPVYGSGGCGNSTSLSLAMGLSIGWGDVYPATLPDQYVDVTGLGAGRYRLQVTADGDNVFVESDELNNTTWVDLQLKANGAPRILAYGPSA